MGADPERPNKLQANAEQTPTREMILAGLRIVRHRQRVWLLWFVLGFVGMGTTLSAVTRSPFVIIPLAIVWFAGLIIVGERMLFSRCPACNELFFFNPDRWGGPWKAECQHCGLALDWEPGAGSGRGRDSGRA
jgi:hypothetical protein